MIAIPIEMPECCDDCPCNDDGYMCGATGRGFYYDICHTKRLPDCPLIDLTQYEDDLK